MTAARNQRITLSLYGMAILIVLYDIMREQANPKWGTRTPMAIMNSMKFMMGIIVPAIFILCSIFFALVLIGNRRGYYGIISFGVLAIVWNIPVTIWRLQADAWDGAAICLFEIVLSAVMIRYAVAASGEGVERKAEALSLDA